jgi:hypothetical protein
VLLLTDHLAWFISVLIIVIIIVVVITSQLSELASCLCLIYAI